MSDVKGNRNGPKKPPFWMQGSQSTGNLFLDLLMFVGGFVALFAIVVGLIIGSKLALGGLTALFDGWGYGFGAQLSGHLLKGALTGAFAGGATAAYRAYRKNLSGAEKAFLSALFTKEGLKNFELDSVLLGRVAIGGIVGLLVGLVASASGAVSVLDLAGQSSNFAGTALGGVIGAGAGGGGGWGDFFGNLFLYGAGLIVLGLLIGVSLGFGIHLLLFAAAGAAKGAAKEYVGSILQETGAQDEIHDPKSVVSGAVRGAIVGVVVGALFALPTAVKSWGLVL